MKLMFKYFSMLCLVMFVSLPISASTCYGTTSNGKLIDAVKLPRSGQNFSVFSTLAWYLGRTYVHAEVFKVILNSFEQLATNYPDKHFMFAETGWAVGGDFAPHKTHQNGLSVDFMVPVLNQAGESVYLPVNISNRWGYDLEFNAEGEYRSGGMVYQVDFEVMAEHLKLLHENAESGGFSIKRVFFDPRLQALLFDTEHGAYIQNNIKFNTQQAWVRHDEHYHVDFDLGCLPL